MTQLLAEKIQDANFKPDIIFAVCPGGAMIAEWLSRRFLGNRLTPTPVQLLYMLPKQKEMVTDNHIVEVDEKLTAIPSGLSKESKVLLVNDISRGGHTLYAASKFLKKHFPEENIRSATLICHEQADSKPMHYVAMAGKTIRFDWKSYDQ